MKERSREEKRAVINLWRSKGKCTVSDDDIFALLYDGKQVCADYIIHSVTVSYLIRYDSLLQNGTILLQNVTTALLQSATEVYYRIRQVFYYKIRQFCDDFMTKCDSYYKMRSLLQIATIDCLKTEVFP